MFGVELLSPPGILIIKTLLDIIQVQLTLVRFVCHGGEVTTYQVNMDDYLPSTNSKRENYVRKEPAKTQPCTLEEEITLCYFIYQLFLIQALLQFLFLHRSFYNLIETWEGACLAPPVPLSNFLFVLVFRNFTNSSKHGGKIEHTSNSIQLLDTTCRCNNLLDYQI